MATKTAAKKPAKKIVPHIPGISDGLKAAKVPISPVVKANGFLFVSGMPPMDPRTGKILSGDIQKQTRQSLEAIKYVLKAAGSSLDRVVSVRVYCAKPAFFNEINEVYKKYFPKNPPARTFVPVASWPMEFDVEIECIALE